MPELTSLLKHIPDAASSPLAFVAYALVVAAWVLRTWLLLNPRREARNILQQFKDDKARLTALASVFNEQPPKGLSGNEAILNWVKIKSSEKTKVLLVVAWLATAVAILLFLVAVNKRVGGAGASQIKIHFHRVGTSGDCPALPITSHIIVSAGNTRVGDARVVENCQAVLPVPTPHQRTATVSLVETAPYELADPNAEYFFANDVWDVYLTASNQARLRITIFDYSGVQCQNAKSAFETFQNILRAKAISLRGMFDAADHRYDYLSGLTVTSAGRALDLSAEEIRDYWHKTASLQILSGLCFRSPQGAELMRSQVFFGNASYGLPEPFLADLPITADEFGATRDIHTASILYALARDAYQRGSAPDVTISYLVRAREVAGQISAEPASRLVKAIEQTLSSLGAPVKMSL